MNNNKPKLSVVMSVYNGQNHLEEAAKSILKQNFRDFEFIIVNDGSTDGTAEILLALAKEDNRIKIISNPSNLGTPKSLNRALKIAQGKYVAVQDADDISLPERFEKQVEFLESHSEVKILGTFGCIIDGMGRTLDERRTPISFSEIKRFLIKGNPFIHSSVMMKKDALKKAGFYNENFRTAQDYELWFRILKLGQGKNLPLFLMKKRYLKDIISVRKENDQIKNALSAQLNAIKNGDYPKFCYIYLLRPYLSLKCPSFLKKFLREYILKSRKVFKGLN